MQSIESPHDSVVAVAVQTCSSGHVLEVVQVFLLGCTVPVQAEALPLQNCWVGRD
jgi:hypothetical protein